MASFNLTCLLRALSADPVTLRVSASAYDSGGPRSAPGRAPAYPDPSRSPHCSGRPEASSEEGRGESQVALHLAPSPQSPDVHGE